MKHLSLIFTTLLAALVVWLLIDQSNSKERISHLEDELAPAAADSSQITEVDDLIAGPIVFVNIDTITKYYNYYNDTKERLTSRQLQVSNDLKRREERLQYDANQLQKKVMEYQKQANSGLMSEFDAIKAQNEVRKIEEGLLKREEDYQRYKAKITQDIILEENKSILELNEKVYQFLDEYCTNHEYQMVLSHNLGGDLLYGSSKVEITLEVIRELNTLYTNEKILQKKDS